VQGIADGQIRHLAGHLRMPMTDESGAKLAQYTESLRATA
jgi:hypothetical protein